MSYGPNNLSPALPCLLFIIVRMGSWMAQTDNRCTDIATYYLNRPRAQFSENISLTIFHVVTKMLTLAPNRVTLVKMVMFNKIW